MCYKHALQLDIIEYFTVIATVTFVQNIYSILLHNSAYLFTLNI